MRRAAGYLGALVVVAAAFALGCFLTRTEQGAGQSAPPVRADRPLRLIDEVRAELTSSYYHWIDPSVLEHDVVVPIENAVASIEGVRSIRSYIDAGHVVMSLFGSFVVALGIVALSGGLASRALIPSALSFGMIVALTGLIEP